MRRFAVSIGIPAHNEEANIHALLCALLRQRQDTIVLREIIVISDGSTDETIAKAKSVKDKRIRVIEQKKRAGMNTTQNRIVSLAKGDALVLLNADVLPADDYLLERIVQPLMCDYSVGIVGGNPLPMKPQNSIEWSLSQNHIWKQKVFQHIRKGETIYLCHGRIRAFSKKMYTHILWPDDCPEDAYSFLRCYELGLRFVFVESARVYFRSPQTIEEHAKQSIRFFQGRDSLTHYFSQDIVSDAYRIPPMVFLQLIFLYAFKHSVAFVSYLTITLFVWTVYKKRVDIHRWDISVTTKKVL